MIKESEIHITIHNCENWERKHHYTKNGKVEVRKESGFVNVYCSGSV